MRLALVASLVLVTALGACDSADKPKSQAEAEQAAAAVPKPKPGQYRSTSKLVSFEVPGMPPAQAEQLRQMFTSVQGREYCLSPQEAAQGMEGAVRKIADGTCKYEKFEVNGGNLDARLICQTGKDMTGKIAMRGTVSEDGSQMHMEIEQAMPRGAPGSAMKMVTEVATQRIGDCPRS